MLQLEKFGLDFFWGCLQRRCPGALEEEEEVDEEEEDEGGKEKEEEEREAGGSSASTPVLALPPRGEANLTLVHKSSKILETPQKSRHTFSSWLPLPPSCWTYTASAFPSGQ